MRKEEADQRNRLPWRRWPGALEVASGRWRTRRASCIPIPQLSASSCRGQALETGILQRLGRLHECLQLRLLFWYQWALFLGL